ncbi:MAG: hypothetical protein OEZ14_09065 [Acidimicrobiia bacterium]|nr:hypothetical protein [Acidimicrobiia bacterium]
MIAEARVVARGHGLSTTSTPSDKVVRVRVTGPHSLRTFSTIEVRQRLFMA